MAGFLAATGFLRTVTLTRKAQSTLGAVLLLGRNLTIWKGKAPAGLMLVCERRGALLSWGFHRALSRVGVVSSSCSNNPSRYY